jgi:hypothetical protein
MQATRSPEPSAMKMTDGIVSGWEGLSEARFNPKNRQGT